ncbi:MAG: AMP-binding protein, partial [Actinobacteria bacterium]|nr:AMP-binding protein [Actinomycetota bacterium]
MDTDRILAERAEIDASVEGLNLGHVLRRNAEHWGDRPAVSWKDGVWRTLTWRGYRDRVAEAAMGLASLGVGPGDFVGIMARNRAEHLIADLGAVHAGATAVSLYNTLAPEQIQYIAAHCSAKVAVVENRELMERWEKVRAELPALEHVVLIDDAEGFAGYEWVLSWEDLMA